MNYKVFGMIVGGAALLLITGFMIYRLSSQRMVPGTQHDQTSQRLSPPPLKQTELSRNSQPREGSSQNCDESGPKQLTTPPVKVEDLDSIVPMGRMSDSHVTPTDHQYWHVKTGLNGSEGSEVRSPADGTITSIQHMTESIVEKSANTPSTDDYRLYFSFSCSLESYYIHIKTIVQKLQDALGGQANISTSIPVKAGEVVGHMGTKQSFDFAVIDNAVTLKGLITPALYTDESWKIHTIDPFEYFPEPIKGQLQAKSLRTAPPLGGKIDYDIDGKVVGNWFQEGTGGYTGPPNAKKQGAAGRYWDGHLAIAYNHIDPSAIEVSIGNWNGRSAQFVIKGNAPDPKDIDSATGVVKYELVPFDYILPNGQRVGEDQLKPGSKVRRDESNIQGTILLQIIENRKLKVETFPGKTAVEVNGFSDKAMTYER